MKINFKNILLSIIVVILMISIFSLSLNLYKLNQKKELVKSKTNQLLKNEFVYNKLNLVLNSYITSLEKSEYNKLKDMSSLYALNNNKYYENLKLDLNLNENNNIEIINTYILDETIYRCEVKINDNNCTFIIDNNMSDFCFKVLNIEIGEL